MEGLLSPYRVLDLTDEKGFLCGKIFGDLGADVIKVERPGGDPARNMAPFQADVPDVNKSLYWQAFNTSKRGITLNLEHARGQELFNQLVKTADFVVESFPPGYMAKLGLEYKSLSKINPRIIMTSISPFGQTGPYRDYKDSDLVLMALAGTMALTGSEDRAPLRICLDQSYCTAGSFAVFATLLANHWRQVTGEGQYVDFSMLEALVCINRYEPALWEFEKRVSKRGRSRARAGAPVQQTLWPCKDGLVYWAFGRPQDADFEKWLTGQIRAEALNKINWDKISPEQVSKWSQAEVNAVEGPIGEFFARYTKVELEKMAEKASGMLVPVRNIADVVTSEHLTKRDYWVELDTPQLGGKVRYPAHLFISSRTKIQPRFPAPTVGEHNHQVYAELGLTPKEIKALEKSGVI